jgi:hypothetical protein
MVWTDRSLIEDKTNEQIACNNWEKIGRIKERKRVLDLLDNWLYEHEAFIKTGSWKELKQKIEDKNDNTRDIK